MAAAPEGEEVAAEGAADKEEVDTRDLSMEEYTKLSRKEMNETGKVRVTCARPFEQDISRLVEMQHRADADFKFILEMWVGKSLPVLRGEIELPADDDDHPDNVTKRFKLMEKHMEENKAEMDKAKEALGRWMVDYLEHAGFLLHHPTILQSMLMNAFPPLAKEKGEFTKSKEAMIQVYLRLIEVFSMHLEMEHMHSDLGDVGFAAVDQFRMG